MIEDVTRAKRGAIGAEPQADAMGPHHKALPAALPWTGERCVPESMQPIDRTLTEHLARYWWAFDRLSALRTARVVLDTPCGAGYGTWILAGARGVAMALGTDIDPDAVDYARSRYGIPGRVNFSVGDLTRLGGSRLRVDAVVCFEGIEHVDDQKAASAGLCHVLKPGGLLLVSTPRANGPGSGGRFHTHELGVSEFVAILSAHLTDVVVHGQNAGVGDASPLSARYVVLEGRRA